MMLKNRLTLSNEEWFWVNPLWSKCIKSGMCFSNRRDSILENILQSVDRSEIGLYELHHFGFFPGLVEP